MKLHVSVGNSKLGRICSVSLTPVAGCPDGIPCSRECYAMKAYRLRPNVRRAWNDNLEFAQYDQTVYFKEIQAFLKSKKHPIKFFRWHVAGDILDQPYLSGMNWLAKMNPDTKFLAFTKNHRLNFYGLNPNLVVILSMWPNWGDLSMVPAHLPIAWMQDGNEKRVPEGALECMGACDKCGLCWHLPELKRDVVFYKH